jgi:hypothetical protein
MSTNTPSAQQGLRGKIADEIQGRYEIPLVSRASAESIADDILAIPEIAAALVGSPATGDRERLDDAMEACFEAIDHVERYNGGGRASEARAMIRKAFSGLATPAVPREREPERGERRPSIVHGEEMVWTGRQWVPVREGDYSIYPAPAQPPRPITLDALVREFSADPAFREAWERETAARTAEPCGTCDGRGCPACQRDDSYERHERAAGRTTEVPGKQVVPAEGFADGAWAEFAEVGEREHHGHQWNAHAICVLCREQAKDLLDSEGMYRACTSRRLAEAEPQRTAEATRERPRCKCEQCSRHDAASPWISDKPGPCDCTECKAHDSCDICRGGRMDEGECCFECGNGVRTPGGALAISESDDQPTATEEAPMFHRFSECALRVLEYLRSAGEPEHTPLVMVSPIPPEDVLAAVNAICAAASALESGDQWTIEQGNALRRAAETLLLVRHREQFAARNLQDRMNAIGRRAAEHCAKLDAAQKQEWTKLGDVQPCPRCGGDAVWVRDSHDPPTYLALDLQCLSGCPHGSGLTVDNLTVAGVWGDEFSRVSDMMDSLGVDERMHLSDEPVPPSSRKEGSDE